MTGVYPLTPDQDLFRIVLQNIVGIVCAIAKCHAATGLIRPVDIRSVIAAVVEQEDATLWYGNGERASIFVGRFPRSAGPFGVAERTMVTARHDPDTSILDRRFLKVDQSRDQRRLPRLLTRMPWDDG